MTNHNPSSASSRRARPQRKRRTGRRRWNILERLESRCVLATSVSGIVFNDLNGDQDWQPDAPDLEPPLDCWTVYLDNNRNGTLDTEEPRQLTVDGSYNFDLSAPGEYAINLVQEPGYDRTTPIGFGVTQLESGTVSDHVFDPTRNVLYSASGDRVLRTNTGDSGELLVSIPVGADLSALDITPDGKFLIVGEKVTSSGQGKLYKIELETNEVTTISYTLETDEGGVFDIAAVSNDLVLFTTTSTTQGLVPLREVNLTTDSVTPRSDDFGPGADSIQSDSRLERNSARTTMVLAEAHSATGPIHLYDSTSNSFVESTELNTALDNAHLSISRDGQFIAVETPDLGLQIYDEHLAPVTTPEHLRGGVAFDSVRNILYAGDTEKEELVAIDTDSWTELYRTEAGEDLPDASNYFEMQVNAQAKLLSVTTPSGVRYVQLDQPAPHIVTVALNDSITNLHFGNKVNGGNRRPFASNNNVTATEDVELNAAAPGVLGNDFDPDGDSLTAELVTGPINGSFSLLADGSFTYLPSGNYHGSDTFTYRSRDAEYTSCRVATVTITTTPVNDPPTGIEVSGTSVEENDPGAQIGTVTVTDPDQTDQFTFTVSDLRFEVVNGFLKLKNGVALNHEQSPTIELTITAFDDGVPSESISTTVLIQVGDVNEFDPTVDTTDVEVEEGQTTVGTVEAHDDDTSQTIEIIIIGGNDDGIFTIDPNTGIISVTDGNELDHEGTQIYVLTISVSDNVEPERTTTADITITVTDGNENDPIVASATYEVEENSPDGTIVGTVSATDADQGQTLTYSIISGNDSGAFEIDSASGEITVADSSQLDRETVAQFLLTVQATDNGSPTRSGTGEITINVSNVNEFDPITSDQTISIDENLEDDTVIAVISATDPDAVSNLTYAITSGGGFSIDSQTGEIKVDDSSALDMESTQQVVLEVTVTDNESPVRSATATVTINLNDVNEFDPSMGDESFTVPEDAPPGFEIGEVSASDQDFTHTFVYSIVGGNDSGFFTIDSATGMISVATAPLPTADSDAEFVLDVRVSDSGNPDRTDDAQVTISVGPGNTPPVASDETFTLEENSGDGTVVGSVTATDADAGQTLSYQLSSGGGAFEIDSESGEITVADSTQLDFETTTQFTLNIVVTDSGNPAKSDDAIITINLTDVNEFEPTISNATFALLENTPSGTVVGTINAVDQDRGQSVTYSISSGPFTINSVSGVVTVSDGAQLDFEAGSIVTATVTATDNGSSTKSATATITVNLQDKNEASPVADDATFSIEENADAGTVLGTITASDADSQQVLSYRIAGGNVGDAFSINAASGEITVRNPGSIDAETIPQFLLLIVVSDSGFPVLSDTSTVTVNVQGVNEAPIAITLDHDVVTEHVPGASVGLVSVVDFDSGDPHTFSVDDGRFTVDSNRILKLKAGEAVDSADGTQIPIEITATDSGGLSVSQNFLIVVAPGTKPPWQNPIDPLDVSNDGHVTPGDVLRVINEINTPQVSDDHGILPPTRPDTPEIPYYDVNGDGVVSPIDVLIIINEINRRTQQQQAEGEGYVSTPPSDGGSAAYPFALSPSVSVRTSVLDSAMDDDADDLEATLRALADDIAAAWRAAYE